MAATVIERCENGHEVCLVCGACLETEQCRQCHGAGGSAPYEDDPPAYAPGEWEACRECRGTGLCPDTSAHTPHAREA